jgi:hypothetical protein
VLYQYAANDFSVIGVAYGRPGRRPDHVIVCPDPLDRSDVAARLQPVRDDMLAWLASHRARSNPARPDRYTADEAPQLIVAGAGVITAVDNLAYGWRYNPALDEDWHILGEELWTLCYFARRPVQSLVVPLAETLAAHYAFGISTLEAAKLSVLVELLNARPSGATLEQLRDAELAESGPLGRPDELDQAVWEAVRARRRPPAIVRRTLLATWDRCNRAWTHLAAMPEAVCATAAAAKVTDEWADRIHAARTDGPYRRRRALPPLASAARELGWMERAQEEFMSSAALEDPLYAAELAGDGKAFRANLVLTQTRIGRSKRVDIDAVTAGALVPPASGSLLGLGGTKARALVADVTPHPGGGWRVRMHVDSQTGGVTAAWSLADGPFWLVPVPTPGPPPLAAPASAPATHPFARGRRSPAGP